MSEPEHKNKSLVVILNNTSLAVLWRAPKGTVATNLPVQGKKVDNNEAPHNNGCSCTLHDTVLTFSRWVGTTCPRARNLEDLL